MRAGIFLGWCKVNPEDFGSTSIIGVASMWMLPHYCVYGTLEIFSMDCIQGSAKNDCIIDKEADNRYSHSE